MAAEAGHEPNRVYIDRNGDLHLNGAKFFDAGEVDRSADVNVPTNGALGVAAGYRIARGVGTLDGANPTAIATGLTTVVAFVATLIGTAAPGVGTSVLTHGAPVAGAVNVYAWKPTSNADPTLVASTGTEQFSWIAVGT